MRQRLHLILFIVVVFMTGCSGEAKETQTNEASPFDQTMREADSLYNSMQFRDAYDLYLELLDDKEAKADSEKMLNVLDSLCMASELADHKMEQSKWMRQLIDLAKKTGNAYYESLGLEAMGKRIYSEGNRQQGIQYVKDALDLIAATDREDADHLAHSYMLILNGLYVGMDDYEHALKTDERNVRLTREGSRWGRSPDQQQRDQHVALAKMAFTLAKLGDFNRADSAYHAWQAISYDGNHARDYFIAGYLRARGRNAEAANIYSGLVQMVRAQGDTLGEMMSSAKWGLAIVCQQMGDSRQAAELYSQVLEIQDTLKQRQARNTAQGLAAVYHAQEQEQKIMQQEAANTRQKTFIIIVLLVLLGVTAYTVNVIRQKRVISQKNHSLAEQITEALNYKELYRKEKLEKAAPPSAMTDLNMLSDEQLFEYINEVVVRERLFLNSNFDRQAIMDRFQLSKERVGAMFSKGSRYTRLSDYTQELRLEYSAQQLIGHQDMSVRQVAGDSGFSSYDYFGKCFRKRYGMTPTEFRTSAKEGA